MHCGLESPNETLNEVKLRVKKCSYAHDAIKSAVKHANVPKNDHLTDDAKEKIRRGLQQSEKAHKELKEYFRQFFSNTELQELFPDEVLRQKYNKLKQDHARIRDNLRKHETQAKDIRRDEGQSAKSERDAFLRQKTDLEEMLAQLQGRCEELEAQNGGEKFAKRKQHQLEETLKTQNELIEDLELRLGDCQRERENFRKLNRILEAELKKNRKPSTGDDSEPKPSQEQKKIEQDPPQIPSFEVEDGSVAVEAFEFHSGKRNSKRFVDLEPIDESLEVSSSSSSTSSTFSSQNQLERTQNRSESSHEVPVGGEEQENRKRIQNLSDEDLLVKQLEGFTSRPILPQAKNKVTKVLGLPLGPLDLPPLPSEVLPPPPPLESLEETSRGLLETSFDDEVYDVTPRAASGQVQYIRESLEKISKIGRDAAILEKEVAIFTGTEDDGGFLHLKKLIIGNLIKLDEIAAGNDQIIIKQRKKEEVRNLQALLDKLRSKCDV